MRSHVRILRGTRNVGRVFGWLSAGSALQAPSRAIGDQEMLEKTSSRGSLPPLRSERGSSTRCTRPVPTMKAARKDGGNRQPHGSLSRPSVAMQTSGTGATATARRSPGWRKSFGARGGRLVRRRRSGPCACTACRSQRGTDLSNGSCSRSYRSGRSRTNGVVVVEARSNGRPERRAEAKRTGGQPSGRE